MLSLPLNDHLLMHFKYSWLIPIKFYTIVSSNEHNTQKITKHIFFINETQINLHFSSCNTIQTNILQWRQKETQYVCIYVRAYIYICEPNIVADHPIESKEKVELSLVWNKVAAFDW